MTLETQSSLVQGLARSIAFRSLLSSSHCQKWDMQMFGIAKSSYERLDAISTRGMHVPLRCRADCTHTTLCSFSSQDMLANEISNVTRDMIRMHPWYYLSSRENAGGTPPSETLRAISSHSLTTILTPNILVFKAASVRLSLSTFIKCMSLRAVSV